MLPRVPVGQTGIDVSPIGLGTVKFGRNTQVKYPKPFELPDLNQLKNLLALSQELGINLLDTAPAYGCSEEHLGQLIQNQRHQWVLCSKVGEEFENNQSTFHFTHEHIRKSIHRSLQRLKTDFLDIILVHSDGNDVSIIEQYGVFDCLADLKQQGLIRAYGCSSKTVAGGLLTLEQADVAMVTYNRNEIESQKVIQQAAKKNKAIFIKKAFASGKLATLNALEDPVQHAMDFVFAQPGVTSIVLGTINPKHLRNNVDCAMISLKSNKNNG